MLIVCPSCAASYRVETACFGEAGRLVRCVHCGDVWLGSESLLVPAVMAQDEEDGIGVACAPDGETSCEELSAPQSSPDIQEPPDEADAFESIAATSQLQIDTP